MSSPQIVFALDVAIHARVPLGNIDRGFRRNDARRRKSVGAFFADVTDALRQCIGDISDTPIDAGPCLDGPIGQSVALMFGDPSRGAFARCFAFFERDGLWRRRCRSAGRCP